MALLGRQWAVGARRLHEGPSLRPLRPAPLPIQETIVGDGVQDPPLLAVGPHPAQAGRLVPGRRTRVGAQPVGSANVDAGVLDRHVGGHEVPGARGWHRASGWGLWQSGRSSCTPRRPPDASGRG